MKSVSILVPASTSNLGPGYDCLGVALAIYNRVITTRTAEMAPATHPMARQGAERFFQAAGCEPFAFRWDITGDVPMSRGMGSSVTLRLGLLHGLNRLAGCPLDGQRIFEICAALEGHPDNAAPAQFGGFTVASGEGERVAAMRFPVSGALKFVLFVPDFEIRTNDARRLLPAEVSRLAAVGSSGRACRITAAFAAGKYEALRGAFEDGAFHQPHRLPLIPFLTDVIAAGQAAGALGGFLSGSGSTIACLTLADAEKVGAAMKEASGQPGGRVLVATADNRGARRAT